MCYIEPCTSVVGINASGMIFMLSNWNMNMNPISEKRIQLWSVTSIGDEFHAYIMNNMPNILSLYVGKSVTWNNCILLNNLFSILHNM